MPGKKLAADGAAVGAGPTGGPWAWHEPAAAARNGSLGARRHCGAARLLAAAAFAGPSRRGRAQAWRSRMGPARRAALRFFVAGGKAGAAGAGPRRDGDKLVRRWHPLTP